MTPQTIQKTLEEDQIGIISKNEDTQIEQAVEKNKEFLNKYPNRFNKILFVVTDVSASYGKALNPHLGIAMLMAYLDKYGFETQVIDMQLGYNVDDIAKKAKEFQADLIGITMFSFDFINTYAKVSKIKELTNIPIILGGAHISTVKQEAL